MASLDSRGLDRTPTWAAVLFCGLVIGVSLLLELVLKRLSEWLGRRTNKALLDALDRVKCELMTVGFMSLILTLAGDYMSMICIPRGAAGTMLPCNRHGDGRRRLSGLPDPRCPHIGMVPLIPGEAMHQLHIFVFFLAIFHVAFSAATLYMGRSKMRIWKKWEKETISPTYTFSCDISKSRLAHQTTFVNQNASASSNSKIVLYITSFVRQFSRSVQRTDYLTLRHGFLVAHLSPGARFNFQNYIKRSLEEDFKTVVHISVPLWASILVVLLASVDGWHFVFWLSSAVRLVVVLCVGMKLQAIIATMAFEIKERHTVIQGMPVVKLSDEHFWLGKPRIILHLIVFVSFQNAFEVTHFFWILYTFGWRSCFHQQLGQVVARVCLGYGAVLQIFCCYIILPLYALVSQMSSKMKPTVFEERTARTLEKWREQAKKVSKRHNLESTTKASEGRLEAPWLRRCKSLGHCGGGTAGEEMLYDPAATMPRKSLGLGGPAGLTVDADLAPRSL